eukprot:3743655-Ditylum_brightwellii.AAC.1
MVSNTAKDKGSQIISEEDKTEDLLAEELEFPLEIGADEAVKETKDKEEVEIEPPTPDFGIMLSPADQLLGDDHVTTAQTADEFNVLEVIVKKTEQGGLEPKVLRKLRDAAEAPLVKKCDMFCTKQGSQELENVYSIALLIKDLQTKIQLYDMECVFTALSFDENGSPTNNPPISLFSHYKILPLERIKQCCRYLVQFGSPYVVQNLQWSAALIINSSKADLENRLKNKLLALKGLEQ